MKWNSVNKEPWATIEGDTVETQQRKRWAYQKFVAAYEFTHWAHYDHVRKLKRLLEGKGSYNVGRYDDSDTPERVEWLDHPLVFKNSNNGLVALISQPYQFRNQGITKIMDIVEGWCLVHPTEYSFYRPGDTFLLMIVNEKYNRKIRKQSQILEGAKK